MDLVSSIDAEDDEPIAWVQASTPLFGADAIKKLSILWNMEYSIWQRYVQDVIGQKNHDFGYS